MKQNLYVITGAGQRVGLYLAHKLLDQGKTVCITYRSEKAGVIALRERGALTVQVDFMQPGSIETLCHYLSQQAESVRALIHNASVWYTDESVADSEAAWDEMICLHMKVPHLLTSALRPMLKKATDRADVIAISDAKACSGHPNYRCYLSSKAGLNSLVQSMAKAYAPDIKVNQVSPGLVKFHDHDETAYREKRLDQCAIPQEPGEEMIWQAVHYLLKAEFSVGANIDLNQLVRPFD